MNRRLCRGSLGAVNPLKGGGHHIPQCRFAYGGSIPSPGFSTFSYIMTQRESNLIMHRTQAKSFFTKGNIRDYMKTMSVEDLFLIRTADFFTSDKQKNAMAILIETKYDRFNWNLVLEKAEKNSIIPQLYYLINSIKNQITIPDEFYQNLERSYLQSISLNLVAKYTLEEVSSLFVENKIEFLLVKGYAIARFYPNYSHRSYVDIDLLIPSHIMFEKASRLLLKAGYSLYSASQPKGEIFYHLHLTKKQRISVEILRDLHWGKYRAFISTSKLFSNAVELSLNDFTIFHVSPEDSVVINCARLLDTGSFLIRDLVDLIVILNVSKDEFDWDYLMKRTKEDGLTPALLSLLYLVDRLNKNNLIPKRIFLKLNENFFSKFLFSLLEKTRLDLPLLKYSNISRIILLFALLQKYRRDLDFFILRGHRSGFGREILKFLSKRLRDPVGLGFLEYFFR